jgi:hypothetical protein
MSANFALPTAGLKPCDSRATMFAQRKAITVSASQPTSRWLLAVPAPAGALRAPLPSLRTSNNIDSRGGRRACLILLGMIMTTRLLSLFCKINTIEHIRAAVCAADSFDRDMSPDAA